jgi:hypothetical protein
MADEFSVTVRKLMDTFEGSPETLLEAVSKSTWPGLGVLRGHKRFLGQFCLPL